jgi:hypothetical protein
MQASLQQPVSAESFGTDFAAAQHTEYGMGLSAISLEFWVRNHLKSHLSIACAAMRATGMRQPRWTRLPCIAPTATRMTYVVVPDRTAIDATLRKRCTSCRVTRAGERLL